MFAYSSLTRDVSDGQILSSNGHCPSGSGGGRPCTSIEVNPMSEMMCLQGYLRARSSKRRTGAGIRHHVSDVGGDGGSGCSPDLWYW